MTYLIEMDDYIIDFFEDNTVVLQAWLLGILLMGIIAAPLIAMWLRAVFP